MTDMSHPRFDADPKNPKNGDVWYNLTERKLKGLINDEIVIIQASLSAGVEEVFGDAPIVIGGAVLPTFPHVQILPATDLTPGSMSAEDKAKLDSIEVGPIGSSGFAILQLNSGGTGSDMSGTGGSGHVVKQDAVGAPLTTGKIVDNNVDAAAAIARSKLAAGSVDHVLINDGVGMPSSEAQLNVSRGGTGTDGSVTGGVGQVVKQSGPGSNYSTGQVLTADIAALNVTDGKLAEPYIKADGTRPFTGDQSMGTKKLTALASPVNGTDATNKDYVDLLFAGFDFKDACQAATTGPLPACTYYNDGGTLGEELIADDPDVLPPIDDVDLNPGDRILVKDQVAQLQNGIYVVTQLGDSYLPWILTRSTDADSAAELHAGTFVTARQGTVNHDLVFLMTSDNPIVIGTSPIVWTIYSGLGEANTATNIGASGVGVYKDKVGVTLRFKQIAVGNGLTVTDDVGNDTVRLDANSQEPVVHQPAGGSLAAADCGKAYTNRGSAGPAVTGFTLPSAQQNLVVEFIVVSAFGIQVNAAASDQIRLLDAETIAAGYITSSDVGSVVRLRCLNDTPGEWFAVSIVGPWDVQTS